MILMYNFHRTYACACLKKNIFYPGMFRGERSHFGVKSRISSGAPWHALQLRFQLRLDKRGGGPAFHEMAGCWGWSLWPPAFQRLTIELIQIHYPGITQILGQRWSVWRRIYSTACDCKPSKCGVDGLGCSLLSLTGHHGPLSKEMLSELHRHACPKFQRMLKVSKHQAPNEENASTIPRSIAGVASDLGWRCIVHLGSPLHKGVGAGWGTYHLDIQGMTGRREGNMAIVHAHLQTSLNMKSNVKQSSIFFNHLQPFRKNIQSCPHSHTSSIQKYKAALAYSLHPTSPNLTPLPEFKPASKGNKLWHRPCQIQALKRRRCLCQGEGQLLPCLAHQNDPKWCQIEHPWTSCSHLSGTGTQESRLDWALPYYVVANLGK